MAITLDVQKVIYNVIANDELVSSLCGGMVFAGFSFEEPTFPAVVLNFVSFNKREGGIVEVQFQVDVYDELNSEKASLIAERIRELFHNKSYSGDVYEYKFSASQVRSQGGLDGQMLVVDIISYTGG